MTFEGVLTSAKSSQKEGSSSKKSRITTVVELKIDSQTHKDQISG